MLCLKIEARAVMFHPAQCSELSLHMKGLRLSVRVLFKNARACWPQNEFKASLRILLKVFDRRLPVKEEKKTTRFWCVWKKF